MNIKINLKLDKTFIFAFVPFLIVIALLITNIVQNATAKEMKFRLTVYDPFDSFYGKYLSINLLEDKVVIPELDGYYISYTDDAYDNINTQVAKIFIDEYKKLNGVDKEKVNLVLKEYAEIVEQHELQKHVYYSQDEIYDKDYYDFMEQEYDYNVERIFNKFKDINKNLVSNKILSDLRTMETLMEQLDDFVLALNHTSMTFDEYVNSLEEHVFSEEDEDLYYDTVNDFNKKVYYIYYKLDDKGYAIVDKILDHKDTNSDNKKCLQTTFRRSYNTFFNTYSIHNEELKFYMDERIVQDAEYLFNKAVNEGKDVVGNIKIVNGNCQVKDILIDNIPIDEYVKLHRDEIYKSEN